MNSEIDDIRDGHTGNVYQTRIAAISVAHAVARIEGYCFVVETNYGWIACMKKPMLRAGQVIECRDDGREYLA